MANASGSMGDKISNPFNSEVQKSSFLLSMIRASITVPIIFIWIIVGLYIWIPLLLRRIFAYISSVISSAITRETNLVIQSGVNLEHSLSFFYDGFVLIFHSLGYTGRHLQEQKEVGTIRALDEVWASTFTWFAILLIWAIVYLIGLTIKYA